MGRRRFGNIRKLPSGKYQASFVGPSGKRQNAPQTFRTRTDADRWLVAVEADISRGTWLDEGAGRQRFEDYAKAYLRVNPDVGLRWEETCLRNMRLHMQELLDMPLIAITPGVVRDWYGKVIDGPGGRTSIAQSYRFLSTVMNCAARERIIPANPCQIRGAGADRAKERPIATPAMIDALVDAITPRHRAAVLLAAWCEIRRGELCGLRTDCVDLERGIVWVFKNRVELLESPVAFDKDPKTSAGTRPIAVPPHVVPYLRVHRKKWAGEERFFVSRDGSPIRGNTISQAFNRAKKKVGFEGSFHDLRHTGQSLAAASGATLADLKKRAGHSSDQAASRYLHSVEGRDREIAQRLSDLAKHGDAAKLPPAIVMR
ncbi:tyrosine-type recombinase/integrase [Nocardia cyriacigeorgica]|uniref:tyrosine-type recombinase/integrase n=1 Tax=Nocardia cyriacigeorgica TaxID=135487 RepID=UPI002458CB90|nr:site-specific integrase [Nocardia cyriacigeorgica]